MSSGVWSNEPVGYAYQWEDCNYKREACTAILGATNADYTVATTDGGYTLVAVVTAINGGGSVSASVAASNPVGTVAAEYALPKESRPITITQGPDGNLWFANEGTSKIGKITTSGAITEYALSTAALPDDITQGSDGNLWFTDSGTSKIGKISTSGTITEYGPLSSGEEPTAITQGPNGNLWFTTYSENNLTRAPRRAP